MLFRSGFIFDWTGTYTPVLVSGGVLMLAAAVVFLRLKPPVRAPRGLADQSQCVPDTAEHPHEGSTTPVD